MTNKQVKRDCLVFSGGDMYGVGRLSPATGGHVSTTCRKGRRCRRQERTLRLGRRLRRGRQQHRGSSYKRVNGMSRFRTRLEGLDFNLHPKKPMAFCSTAMETLYGSADWGSP